MSAKRETAKDQRRGPGRRFEKGVSGNPKGRPRSGESLAEAYRRKLTPEQRANLVIKLARTAESEQVRLSAAMEICNRADGKAPQMVDLTVAAEESAPLDWGDVPLERQRELIAGLAVADEIALPGDDDEAPPEG